MSVSRLARRLPTRDCAPYVRHMLWRKCLRHPSSPLSTENLDTILEGSSWNASQFDALSSAKRSWSTPEGLSVWSNKGSKLVHFRLSSEAIKKIGRRTATLTFQRQQTDQGLDVVSGYAEAHHLVDSFNNYLCEPEVQGFTCLALTIIRIAEVVRDQSAAAGVTAEDREITEAEQEPAQITSSENIPLRCSHLVPDKHGFIKSALLEYADSTSFLRSAGLPKFMFTAVWRSEQKSTLSDLNFNALLEIIHKELEVASPGTLAELWQTAYNIQRALPGVPNFTLRLHNGKVTLPIDASTNSENAKPFSPTLNVYTHFPDPDQPKQPPHIRVDLPTITLVQPQIEDQAESSPRRLHVRASLTVHARSITSITTNVKTMRLVEQLLAVITNLIRPLVEEQRSPSVVNLAWKCVAALVDESQAFSGAIKPRRVEIAISLDSKDRLQKASRASRSIGGTAYIALGSNVGHRLNAIEAACQILNEDEGIRVLETSPLYETDPMYVEEQGKFVNGVCKIETDLAPLELLDRLQAIENDLGRVKTIDKGPRNIDLDVILYNQDTIATERLNVPHKLMLEREFVLRPLADTSAEHFKHPGTGQSIAKHFSELPPSETPMYPLTPLTPETDPLRSLDPKRRTLIMSILNVTPDSFSDGGDNEPANIEKLKETVAAHIAAGATIIDIGGQSSRPNAPDITAEEEIARILPAIEAIKSIREAPNIAISVDTYRASVAEAAVKAGAHIVNDISAGLLDQDMLPTIARLGCTYIMMHMRGTPATMQTEENTSYPNGLIPTIAAELHNRLQAAQEVGMYRWRIILDPGVGFAKTTEQNAQLLGKFSELRHTKGLDTFPWLVGSSRKGFIGKLTGVTDAKDRVEGTAATVTAAIQGGAEIVRVHDVKEMVKVAKMADAMYRS